MRVPWKVVGLAGIAGVAATGAVIVRKRRAQQDYDPDELRARLHSRLAQVGANGDVPAARAGDAATLADDE
jgi:hypothetical protein